jgi:Domain of unknown function (DUF4175)
MGEESTYYKEIIEKLSRLRKKEHTIFAYIGVQAAFIIGLILFVFFSLLELIGNFSPAVRTYFFFFILLIFLSVLTILFIVPLLKYSGIIGKTDYFVTASRVGKSFPEIKDDLVNAMQLASSISTGTIYSGSLSDAAFHQVYNKTKGLNFETIVSSQKAKEIFLYLAGITIFATILFLVIPGLSHASGRILNFNTEFIPPAKFTLVVQPGNVQATKGDNVNISVKVNGEKPEQMFLATKTMEQTDFEMQKLTADSNGVYNFPMKSVRSSTKYYAEAENISSEVFNITVIDPPIIKTLDVKVIPPGYSKLPVSVQKDNGNVTGLPGTTVNIFLSSTKELSDVRLVFNDSSEIKLKINNNEAEGKFIIMKDNSYKIVLHDENGNENLSPITYSVKSLYDAYPSIEIVEPNKNTSLANDSRLPLQAKVSDDYGFTKLELNYRLSASKYSKTRNDFSGLEIPFDKNLKDEEVNYIWNLAQLNLTAEDVVTYYLEIFDNDYVNGPKSTKSATFTVRVPTLDEILSQADNTQTDASNDLNETFKQAEELQKKFEKIDQDLKQDKKDLSWEEKEKIEKAMDEYQNLQDKVGKVGDKLKQMQQQLQDNNLLSKETMEKYMELQKLMDEMTSPELKKLMERMQDVLKNMNRQMTQDQMQNMKIDEEQFKKSIERTMNLLKRIQIEQKMDELVKRAEELKKEQDELKKETQDNDLSKQENKDQLSRKQDEVTKDLDKLSKEMKDLQQKMSEMKDMPSEDLQKLSDEFDKQQNQQMSQQASQQMQQNQQQQAMQNQQQISQNMQSMQQQLSQMQQSMQKQNQMQTLNDMMRILDNLLTLSKQQEELKKESESLDPNSNQFRENAEKQSNLQSSLNNIMKQMSELSQKTFGITPEMGKTLGDALKQMNQAVQNMQSRNGIATKSLQGGAMKSLNEAATMMKGSMESMMQGGQGGGMMSLMQQLQQMSGQQMNLNNMTQMLQQMQQGQLSQQQQAQLQRLAQQQDVLRKSLDQLNKEAKQSGESKKIPANLEDIMHQMQEVITDMHTEKLNDDLIQKQERILSKLLDAQKSINQRDFEKERESNTGKNIAGKPPAELNLSTEQGKDKLRDELNKAVHEGYTKDYEELIRKYYDALQKDKIKN